MPTLRGQSQGVLPHESTHVSGGSDAFLSTDILEAIVKRLRETGGPTTLAMGAVADGEFLKRSGSSIVGGTAGSAPVPVRMTADQSITSSTTLTNVTDMVKSIAANEEWLWMFDLDIGAALKSTGIKIAVTVPSGATMNLLAIAESRSVGLSSNVRRTTSSGGALDWDTNFGGDDPGLVHVLLWVLNSSNAGNMQLQFAQSSSSGSALTIRKGSGGTPGKIA